jgi:hypothetical protein
VSGSASLIDNGSLNLLSNEGGTQSGTTLNLNGGTFALQNFVRTGGGTNGANAETINFNGGTMEALASDPFGSQFLPVLTALSAKGAGWRRTCEYQRL